MSTFERKTRGRQKVALVRMEKQSNRLVTFSKRRSGLFKKASELCTLCDAQAAIVVFSPGRKTFSFGHPSVDAIINRFMTCDPRRSRGGQHPQTLENLTLSRTNMELALLNNQVEIERRLGEVLMRERQAKSELRWLTQIEELRVEHLKELLGSMIELRDRVRQSGQKWLQEATDSNFMAMDPSRFPFPPSMAQGFGGQPSMLMVSNPIERNPNEPPPMVMIPTPMVGYRDPSLVMGSNGLRITPTNPLPSMPNYMGGFDALNVQTFQDANNPMGGQLDVPLYPMNMLSIYENFTSLVMGDSPKDTPNDAFNPQVGFGYGYGYGYEKRFY